MLREERGHLVPHLGQGAVGEMVEMWSTGSFALRRASSRVISVARRPLLPSLVPSPVMSVLLETSLGDIVIDLEVDSCPKTCENFLKLCKVYYYNLNAFFNGM